MIINCQGRILNLTTPKVMGILNVTPDSFYDGGRFINYNLAIEQAEKMIQSGVDIIDIGGMSSRPGADIVSSDVECQRVIPIIKQLRESYPNIFLSIDTVHGSTVKAAADVGVDIVNDISAGDLSTDMLSSVAESGLPYILMHMQGRPETMQDAPNYGAIVKEIAIFFKNRIRELKKYGIKDIIIDPGFGFGKEVEDNYRLLNELSSFKWIGCPMMVGLSRKSMIYKPLKVSPNEALNGSSALHMAALMNGASILRVHDVREAKEVIKLHQYLLGNSIEE